MRTAIVIPARLESTRLPNKPLVDLGGLPLVVRVAQQASRVPDTEHVAVATDSQQILDELEPHGIRGIVTRSDHVSGTDRVAEAAASLDVDFIINLQGDEPFVQPRDLLRISKALEQTPDAIVTLRTPIREARVLDDPHVVKVVCRTEGEAMYFSRSPIPHANPGDLSQAYAHLGVYGYSKGTLNALTALPPHPLENAEKLEQLRALANGWTIRALVTEHATRGIDTPEDLEWARGRVASLGESAFPQLDSSTPSSSRGQANG